MFAGRGTKYEKNPEILYFELAFRWQTKSRNLMQPRGVMVAQVILVHLVEVRILAGLPFLFLDVLLKRLSFSRIVYSPSALIVTLFT